MSPSSSSSSSSPCSRTKRSSKSTHHLLIIVPVVLAVVGCHFVGSDAGGIAVLGVSAYQSGIPPSSFGSSGSSSSRRPIIDQQNSNGDIHRIVTNNNNINSNDGDDGVMDQYEAALRAASSAAAAAAAATGPEQSTPSSVFSDYDQNQKGSAKVAGTDFGYFSSLGGVTENFDSAPAAVTPAFTSPSSTPVAAAAAVEEDEMAELSSSQQQQQQQQQHAPRPSYRIPRSIDTMLEEIESEIQAVDEQLRLTAPPSTVQDYVQDVTYVLNSAMSDAMAWWISPEGRQTRAQLVEQSRNVLEHTAVKTRQVVHTAKETWEEEDGDVAKFSQHVLRKMQDSAEQAKVVVAVKVKETVESEDFKNLPKHGMNALKEFWVSEHVQQARKTASDALMKALKV